LVDNAIGSDPRIIAHKAAEKQLKLVKEESKRREKQEREESKMAESVAAQAAVEAAKHQQAAAEKAEKETAARARKAFTKQCKKQGVLVDEGAGSSGGMVDGKTESLTLTLSLTLTRAEMEELRSALPVPQLQALCSAPDRFVAALQEVMVERAAAKEKALKAKVRSSFGVIALCS
jgi:DnaJ family protein C protein 2